MKIKDFASKYQIQPDTVRYYEKVSLLNPVRQENNYRDFDEDCEKQIQLIIVLKQLGFTIKEIQQLLILREDPALSAECKDKTVSLLDRKIMNLEERIRFYQQALKVVQAIKELASEVKYSENIEDIERLVLSLFQEDLGGAK
ncbi:MerR family transcriptional regulator [Saccharibacillus alkalitolerans]|uniref:MerR family transcriptional regulator n=1 Tax=Saccharibacillus alkalitolerans TaxID=2705290 RepID=A0ABX0F6I2_9BACL|nr:MerR family transcriptional regulator [Saccharibacillus alkalitolerans]NGZ76561.1 MerR family transcriptional regulator [Saccharibacillus alkalitolerans]